MSKVQSVEVISTLELNDGARLLRCRTIDHEALDYQGGQYIIINSGLLNEEGKPRKRAYTLFAMNPQRTEFSLVAERLPWPGVAAYLNERVVGDRLDFTGPWGKFKTLEPHHDVNRAALCLAVGTGINAMLGILSEGLPAPRTSLLWLRDSSTAFMSDSCLHDHLPQHLEKLLIEDLPQINIRQVQQLCQRLTWAHADHDLYIAGEGHWVDGIYADFIAAGVDSERIRKEVFYRSVMGV